MRATDISPSRMMRSIATAAATLALGATGLWAQGAPEVVTLDVPSQLVEVRVMVRAGSAHDPAGKEGLAALTARALLEAGFGDPDQPVTKEQLAQITRPWGSGARPGSRVDKESTTFIMTIPRDVLDRYLREILRPMFTRPVFIADEVQRIRSEMVTNLQGSLRYENLEMAGLEALDNYVHRGTSHGHTVQGSVEGLESITRDDVRRFYATYYQPELMILGVSTSDEDVVTPIRDVLADAGALDAQPFPEVELEAPPAISGRELTVVAIPDAGATGIHAGFPIPVTRKDDEYWPLYVANVYFGTHRDSHSHLYKKIRQERGYNYGDYSYVEHFAGRPFNLFPPFNTPRSYQYFSMWIRPVGTEYAHHILKAMTWELENLVRNGIPEDEIELSKNKARVLYLNLAENSSRLLAARVDDAFYGMAPGYLEGYLERIAAVTPKQVNDAIRRYLQTENIKFLIATEAGKAEQLAQEIREGGPATGKTPEDYRIESETENGRTVYHVSEENLEILRLDAVWEHYPMELEPARVQLVPVEALFETGAFLTETTTSE